MSAVVVVTLVAAGVAVRPLLKDGVPAPRVDAVSPVSERPPAPTSPTPAEPYAGPDLFSRSWPTAAPAPPQEASEPVADAAVERPVPNEEPTVPVVPASPAAQPLPELVVTAVTDRAHYYAGEQVGIVATVCNPSDRDVSYEVSGEQPFEIDVQADYQADRGTITATAYQPDDYGGPYAAALAAGECRSFETTWDRTTEQNPPGDVPDGTYRVKAQHLVADIYMDREMPRTRPEPSAWFALHSEARPDHEPAPPQPNGDVGVAVRVSPDKPSYDPGETVRFQIDVCNTTDQPQEHRAISEEPMSWHIGYRTHGADGSERQDTYANGGNYPSNGVHDDVYITFGPRECRSFDYDWDQVVQYAQPDDPRGGQVGERAPPGEYRIDAKWDAHDWDGRPSHHVGPVHGQATLQLT